MTKIYYSRQFGIFECVKIEGEGRLAKFIFDEPLNAKLSIGKKRADIKSGELTLDLELLSSGVYEPQLITKNRMEAIGKIRLTDGGVSHNSPDFEFVRLLAKRLEELRQQVCSLKAENEKLKEKIYGTTIF